MVNKRDILILWGLVGILAAGLWNPSAPAAAGYPDTRLLRVSPNTDVYSLTPYMDVAEDPGGGMEITGVASPGFLAAFRANRSKTLNFGVTPSVYWLRFTVAGTTAGKKSRYRERVLGLGEAFTGRVEWTLYNGKTLERVALGGVRTARNNYVRLDIPLQPVTYYLRVASDTGLVLNPRLYTWTAHMDAVTLAGICFGLFYGIILAVAVYNLFLYFSFNDASYFWYMFHLVFVVFYFLGINGLIGSFLLPDRPDFMGMLNRFFLGMMSASMALLTRSFLMTRIKTPGIDRLILILFYLALALSVLNCLLPARYINTFLVFMGILMPMAMGIASWGALKKGFKPALPFMAAWGLFEAGVLSFALTVGGVLPYSTLGFNGFQIGSALAAVLLSIALGHRIRSLRDERASFKQSMERVSMILDSMDSGVFLIERSSRAIREVNRAAEKIVGQKREEIIGRPCWQFIRTADNGSCPIADACRNHDCGEDSLIRASGEKVPVLKRVKLIALDGHDLILESFVDITHLKAMENELKRLAATDPLTGADNRRSFLEKGAYELRRSRRYDHPFAFLMLDVDHFKTVNDTYGHPVGDEVLKALVSCSMKVLRDTDLFGRLGGEEFAAILPETDLETATAVGERLRDALSRVRVEHGDGEIRFTVSIGLAMPDEKNHTLEAVMGLADAALYRAKIGGRNRLVCA